jgi:hypothetical protein
LVNSIVEDILDDDSLSFDLEIGGYGKEAKGFLFYYRLELTNNEGFNRRYTKPVSLIKMAHITRMPRSGLNLITNSTLK